MDKEEIRREVASRLKQLSPEKVFEKSQGIIENLNSINLINTSISIGAYIPTPSEPQLLPWIAEKSSKKIKIQTPQRNPIQGSYHFTMVSLERLSKNQDNILESAENQNQKEQRVPPSVVIVPGRAFDKFGHRIGRGKGHYDTLLTSFNPSPIKIGVCFSEQLFQMLPHYSHDIIMDIIVTEKQVYLTSNFFDAAL